VVGPYGEQQRWADWPSFLNQQSGMWELFGLVTGLRPNPTVDPVSGEGLLEEEIFVALPPGPDASPPPPEEPLPATASACVAERERLRLQIVRGHEALEASAPAAVRFERAGAANPKLAQELRRQLAASFPGLHTGNMEVRCRGQICSSRWPTGPGSWRSELDRNPWMRTHIERRSHAPNDELYLDIATRPRADGTAFLRGLVDRFERSSVPGDCASRAPGTGMLLVKFDLQRTEDGDQPEDAALTARFGGSLAATPLGRCLQAAIERDILAAPLPAQPVSGAMMFRRFEFPRSPDGRAAPAVLPVINIRVTRPPPSR
jgi:hypothetical protein